MPLNYQTKDGIVYAKDPGVSYRTEKGIRKKDAVYLGRVLDKEKNIFYNKKRGVFHYDLATHTFTKADDRYLALLKSAKQEPVTDTAENITVLPTKKEERKQILDFGDAFFLDTVLKSTGYDAVVKSIRCENQDSLMSMLLHCIIAGEISPMVKAWWEGSYASILYPNAKLSKDDISQLLRTLGKTERQIEFFSSHNRWLKKCVSDEPAVLIEHRGDSGKTNFPESPQSVCMIFAVQKNSGYPMLCRLVHGAKAEVSSLSRTVSVLSMYGAKTGSAILESFLFSGVQVDELFRTGIDFISAVPKENRAIWNAVTTNCLPLLRKAENLVQYNGRSFYLFPCKMMLGSKRTCPVYAYLGCDASLPSEQAQESGLFLLISSANFRKGEILPAYETRLLAGEFSLPGRNRLRTDAFDDSEESVLGQMILTQMAATVTLYLREKLAPDHETPENLLMTLRNQKCEVYKSRISACETTDTLKNLYSSFEIQTPSEIKRNADDNRIPPDQLSVKIY